MIKQKGQSLVELLVVIGLSAIILPAFLTGLISSRSGRAQQQQKDQATIYLKETEEIIRHLKDSDWSKISPVDNSHLHIDKSSNSWVLSPGTTTIGDFTQGIQLSPVYRDNDSNILPTGNPSQIDPSTVKVLTTISWTQPISTNLSTTTYLTRYNHNFTETIDYTNVELELAGNADWCQPGNPIVGTSLPGNGQAKNGLAGNVVAGLNQVYAGTGKNASSYPFYNIKIDNSVFPPVISLIGHYDSPGLMASDVFGTVGVGGSNYAYISPDSNNNAEIIILDVSNSNPSFVATIDIDGIKGSKSVFVGGNYLYFIGFDNVLYVYEVSDPYNPQKKGEIFVGDSNKMYVVDNYVYIAQNLDFSQLLIINATDPGNLSMGSSLQVNNQPGVDVFVKTYMDNNNQKQTRAYLITKLSTQNFYIINANNPNSPQIINPGYSTNPMDYSTSPMEPTGITVIDNRAIIVGENRPQYQVRKVDNDEYNWCANIPNVNNPDIDDINDVSSISTNGHAYSYLVTSNKEKAFQIIEGGSGGSGGYYDYYYTSPSIDTLTFTPPYSSVVFNRFTFSGDNLTTGGNWIKFQVAVADPGPSGNCSDANYIFVGSSSLDTNAWFSDNNPIPWNNDNAGYENPARCFKYKAWLHPGDPKTTTPPVLKSFTVNYSP